MKKPILIVAEFIWNKWTQVKKDSDQHEKKDNIKLAKELIFKDNSPQEIIFIIKELEKEVRINLAKTQLKNELENKAIDFFFNPVVNSFKNRAEEIKVKYNHSFKNRIEAQEYAKC